MVAIDSSSGAWASLSRSSTVLASMALAPSTAARRLASGEPMSLLSTRSIEATTSAASMGVPSWNFTFARSLKR